MTRSPARTLVLGTRGSKLALAQARIVAEALGKQGDIEVEIQTISTSGDKTAEVPRGEGVFVKEIQRALLAKEIDLAVHSLKDIPTKPTEGLTIAAIPPRARPNEVLYGDQIDRLPPGARVGTGSPRRAAQLKGKRRDLQPVPIRGNVPTRISKVEEGDVDAALLALAGLDRLGIEVKGQTFSPTDFVPAPGQGALAVEVRVDEPWLSDIVATIDDAQTRAAVGAERAVLAEMGGGCMLPIGVFARVEQSTLEIHACIVSESGDVEVRSSGYGDVRDPTAAAHAVVRDLREKGALELL